MHNILKMIPTVFLGILGTNVLAQNLLENPGFDDSPTSDALISPTRNGDFKLPTLCPPWLPGMIGGSGSSAAFSVKADPSAISSPNVLEINRVLANECRVDYPEGFPVISGNAYKVGYWGKAVTDNGVQMSLKTELLDPDGFFLGPSSEIWSPFASAAWQRIETTLIADSGDPSFPVAFVRLRGFQEGNGFHGLVDSFSAIDVTASSRVINGGFENSPLGPIAWNLGGDAGQLTATIIQEAAEGNNALRLVRNDTVGDPTFNNDGDKRIPWIGGHDVIVKISLKDDPTIGSGEFVNVGISCFNAAGTYLAGLGDHIFQPGADAYARYAFESSGNIPAETAKICVTLRIVDASGAAKSGDVLIDGIIVGDLTAGYSEPINAATHWLIY